MGRERLAQALTQAQEEILIGSLLGDARLECRSREGTARLRIHHAESQREYLFGKFETFRPFVSREPWRIQWFDDRTQGQYAAWFFHTRTSEIFRPYHRLFYRNGLKILPSVIHEYLTPLVLAVWIMDDGCCGGKEMILNTQSFPLEEQGRLQSVFLKKLGIHASVQRDRRNFRLLFNQTEARKLSNLVRPFIIPSMQRKLLPVTTDPAPATTGQVRRHNHHSEIRVPSHAGPP